MLQDEESAETRDERTARRCPLCGSGAFAAYRGRPNARCRGCGSKERERLMALVLSNDGLCGVSGPVYHFAPERALSGLLKEKFGDFYRAADIEPDQYSWVNSKVERVDLANPLEYFRAESVAGFVHSHVLEHVPASVDKVVSELNEALMPGGFHAFQVPIHNGWYREDMDPAMSPEERKSRFFQEDHLRVFGVEDFRSRVIDLFADLEQMHLPDTLKMDELIQACVPASALQHLTGHSVFLFKKPLSPKPVWWRTEGKTRLTFPGPRVVEFTHPPRFHLPRYLKANGVKNYEPLTLAAFLAACEVQPGAIIDIGANIGVFAVSAAAALRKQVLAFEPFSAAADVLERIRDDYGLTIKVSRDAVSAEAGAGTLYLSNRSDMSNSLNAAHRGHSGAEDVNCVSLDDIGRHTNLAVVKIDTETTEFEILRGGRATLERDRPFVFLEVLEGSSEKEIEGLLGEIGYTLTFLDDPVFVNACGGTRGLDIEGDRRNGLAAPERLDEAFFERTGAWLDHLARLPA